MTPAEKLAGIGQKMDRKWHEIEPGDAPGDWEQYPGRTGDIDVWTLVSERHTDRTFKKQKGPDGKIRYFQKITPHGRRGHRGYTSVLNESLLVTRQEHAMLNEIGDRYAYQPPAELLDTANALISRGLVEVTPGFSCLQLTQDGSAARHHGPASVDVYLRQGDPAPAAASGQGASS